MANDKRFVVKNGLRTQNIDFSSPDNAQGSDLVMENNGTLVLQNRIGSDLLSINTYNGTTTLVADEGGPLLIGKNWTNLEDKVQIQGTVHVNGSITAITEFLDDAATTTGFIGDITGSLFAGDSSILVDANNSTHYGTFVGDTTGSLFAGDSSILVDANNSTHYGTFIGTFLGEADGQSPNFEGDLKGSVFGDDSSTLIDAINGIHYGKFIGQFESADGGAIVADFKGSLFGDDSSLLVDGLTGNHYGIFNGSFIGDANAGGPTFIGDLTGSVFADDSTLLVDAVGGKLILDNNTTDELPEGDANQYYTKTRVQRDSRIISLIFGS